ncbi:MAG: EamA family transporter [Deltaproteobacteria bacterium]|nr:EamA family transporter [Deltaproteobacteria bacterium]MBW2011713.1 EamA family transporter [Deltaproteobacteria bacterium]
MTWIFVMTGAAVFFALNEILKKKILENADVIDMMVIMGSIGFLAMLPFFKFIDPNVSIKNLLLIALNTLLFFGGSFLFNLAYKHCEISTVSPLFNLNPLLVIFISYFILGEVLNGLQFLGVFLILIGGYIITLKNIKKFFRPFTSMPKKYFTIVISALVMWSFCPVINRIVLFEIDSFTYLFFHVMFVFFIQIFLIVTKKNRLRDVVALTGKSWPLLTAACVCWLASDFLHLIAIAIPETVVSLAMPVKRISTLFIVILGGNLFNEKDINMKSTACVVMLAGLFVIGFYS